MILQADDVYRDGKKSAEICCSFFKQATFCS
jgi:hypothetical protein